MAQVGRISGPLLTANLQRNGINLDFRNTISDTQLLLLDVNTGKIAVNKGSAAVELDVSANSTIKTTNFITNNQANVANFTISSTLSTSDINVLVGNINLNAGTSINLSNFETDNIHISDNTISTFRSNAALDIMPTGTLEVFNNLETLGNIHATGNITADGDITIGDSGNDSVVFNADVASNIIPDVNNTYNIGSSSKRWSELWNVNVNGAQLTVDQVNVLAPQTTLGRRVGNIFYVAENGDDTNVGDHTNGPFKTLKHALSVADASTAGPVTIYVMPGGYEEELPLVVPTNTSVIGVDMRNTFIRPESAYQSEDVFHLNGESTVQNLTVTDFYYDSGNDKGYAFRFAPGAIISTRSPYVQNVSVITKGTTTTPSDPRGFASGDAGKGALVDGGVVPSASEEASMLFHSCTFITPGVDALTMTNGVRVEWLNSFTYFANRGLYAVDGATGHLSTDGSTVKYGAELRSIGSANVYGNYGAVADGADCLMYLIQHNFGYVGAGKFVDNDPSRAVQTQEVTELNSGRIYFSSIDHLGNFRVGNEFFADQANGTTSIDLSAAEIDSLNGISVTTSGQTTLITGEKIDIGNFVLQGNLIQTLTGAVNVSSITDINLTSNVNIYQNLNTTGDLTIGGSLISLGDQPSDTVNFNTPFSQNIEPDISGLYNLGSATKKWSKAWLSQAQIADIKFQDNFITTTESNADLELRANSIGRLYLPNNDFEITNALTVNGVTDIQSASITGTVGHTGNKTQTGDYSVSNLTVTQDLTTGSQAQFEEILIDGNVITTTSSNADLELRASGTGRVLLPNNNVIVNGNVSARDVYGQDLSLQGTLSVNQFLTSSQIKIDDNYITTTLSNSDLELRANGTGGIRIFDDMVFNQNVLATATSDLEFSLAGNLNITSTSSLLLPIGDDNQRIETNAGEIRFSNVSNLFEGYGTNTLHFGGVYSSDRLTNITANNSDDIQIVVAGYTEDSTAKVGEVTGTGLRIHGMQVDDVLFNNNTITTSVSNSDLELGRNGLGEVTVANSNISFKDSQIKDNTSTGILFANTANGYIKFAGTGGVVFPAGNNTTERGSNNQIGDSRWNTTDELMEVWDGTAWISAQGGGESVTQAYMDDLSNEWTLILG